MRRFYVLTRDLHLYVGLFLSPFVLVFACSVFYLVHGLTGPNATDPAATSRSVDGLHVSADIARLQGRARVDAVRPVLDQLGVFGEVDFIRHVASEQRLVIPVRVPGRETTVDLDYVGGRATVSTRRQGLGEVLVYLHKTPGPHNVDVRGNSAFMRVWHLLADASAYLLLFLTISGVYLWAVLRAERKIGLAMISAGAVSFFLLVYVVAG